MFPGPNLKLGVDLKVAEDSKRGSSGRFTLFTGEKCAGSGLQVRLDMTWEVPVDCGLYREDTWMD